MSDYEVVINTLSSLYDRVNGCDFYEDIFPNNENEGELNKNFSKPNAIYLYQDENKKMKRRIMLKDKWEEDYMNYVECNHMTLCSGLAYRGRVNKLEKAQRMNALIFDLDGVGKQELKNILSLMSIPASQAHSIPVPTYMVASGSGLHLYYVFKEPIDLYPNIKVQMKRLKYDLTFRMWNPTITSKEEQIQYQSINQAFRMVGSINAKHNTEVVAFKVGDRVSLDYLNAYCYQKDNQVDINRPFRPSKMTRNEAKDKYSEWYDRVVVGKDKRAKKWDIKGKQGYSLYEWWRTHASKIRGGHRYFYLMCMSIYASKCDVPFKKLKEDMAEDFRIVAQKEHSNPLTEDDMKSALEMYSREYYNFRIEDIEKLTDIRIERNRRNYRSQEVHLRMARSNLKILNELHEKSLQGRKPKQAVVEEWQQNNPNGSKYQCIKETGLSKKTVYKWWR